MSRMSQSDDRQKEWKRVLEEDKIYFKDIMIKEMKVGSIFKAVVKI